MAEWTGFENQRVLRGTGGSNPSLSAIFTGTGSAQPMYPRRAGITQQTNKSERCQSG